jgi:hypothetical protein
MPSYDDVMTALRNADSAGAADDARELAQIAKRMQQRSGADTQSSFRTAAEHAPAVGVGEAALSLGTGLAATAAGGLAGIAGSVLPGPPGQGADVSKRVQEAGTYQPRTKIGKGVTAALSYIPEAISAGADIAGRKTTDVTGSPLAGTAVNTALQAAPMAVGGALGQAGKLKLPAAIAGDTEAAGASLAKSSITTAQHAALDTLERFSRDPAAIARTPTTRLLEGSAPTLAETTGNPGLAQLQRAQQSKSPGLASEIHERKGDRLRARENVMETVAGSEGEMEYYREARKAITDPLYQKARETPIDPKRITPELQAEIDELMTRPTVQEARAEAIKKARDSGEVLGEQDLGSVKGLHWMKRSIDDKISAAKRAGSDDQARIYLGIQEKLIGLMQELSPDYAKAMAEYQAASRPINRLEVGQYLKDKLFPASNQYGGRGTTVSQFAKALEHPDQIAKLATGFSGAKLSNILTESEIKMLKDVARDVVREQNVEGAARVTGSPTAQLTAAQQRLTSILDKLEAVPFRGVKYPAKAANYALEKYRGSGAAQYEAELNKMIMNPAYARSIAALRDSAKGVSQGDVNRAGIGQ